MRLTISLDSDVEKRLEKFVKDSHETKRSLLNRLLRTGLDSLERETAYPDTVITVKAKNLGLCKYPSLDNISDVLAAAEGDTFK